MPSTTDVQPTLTPEQARGEILRRSSRLRTRRRIQRTTPLAIVLAVLVATAALGGGTAQSLRTVPADDGPGQPEAKVHAADEGPTGVDPVDDAAAAVARKQADVEHDVEDDEDPPWHGSDWPMEHPSAPPGFSYPSERMVLHHADEDGRYTLWTMKADGTDRRGLGIAGKNGVLSPDGRRIAYSAYDVDLGPGARAILNVTVASLETGETRKVVATNTAVSSIDWSPSGTQLAFSTVNTVNSGATLRAGEVWVVNVDGSGLRKVADGSDVQWSPHGDEIMYECGNCIEVVHMATGALRRIADFGSYPAWSPDGTRVACIDVNRGQLLVMDADGTNRRLLAQPAWKEPSWSHDGTAIAFNVLTSDRGGTQYSVWLVRPDGSDGHAVHVAPDDGEARFPSLRPAGS